MKSIKKIGALVVAMLLALVMAVPAMADQTVTLSGGEGSITITNATKDQSYTVYRLFDAKIGADNSGAIVYETTKTNLTAGGIDGSDWFTLANGKITAKDSFDESVLKSENFKTWAKAFGTLVGSTVEAADTTLKFDKIPFGYYFIESTLGVALTVDSANPDAIVVDKNQGPSWDNGDEKPGKVIIENNQKVTVNEASLNEDIEFDIGVDATNYHGENKIHKYIIYDEMDPGMTYKKGTLTVKVGDQPLTASDYTIEYYTADGNKAADDLSDAQSFRVDIKWTQDGTKDTALKYESPVEIHVNYHGFLDAAKGDKVKYTAANNNKANFDWVDDGDNNEEPDKKHPNHQEPEKTTETFTTQLKLKKVDENGDALTGAEFTLTTSNGAKVLITTAGVFESATEDATHYKLNNGKYTTQEPTDETKDAYAELTKGYKIVTKVTVVGEEQTETTMKGSVGNDGTLLFQGLGAGDYKLSETQVPDGYNKAADIEFTVSFNATTQKFASDNSAVTLNDENYLETTVENKKGAELPSTGGIGTTIFYAAGSVLVLAAVVLLVTKRRMTNR